MRHIISCNYQSYQTAAISMPARCCCNLNGSSGPDLIQQGWCCEISENAQKGMRSMLRKVYTGCSKMPVLDALRISPI